MTQGEALSILKTGANVYLTGEPGSGKTHTVNTYISWLRSHGIEPSITASTGIAATHVKGMTIHSWSGIGVKDHLTASDIDTISSKEHLVRRIQNAKVLIVDEISMLAGNVLEMVNTLTKEVRQSEKPFGGLQVVLVGDFFQLPPISKAGREVAFAFESSAWRELNPLVCYLSEQHRQEDPVFLSLLTAIRTSSTDESHVSKLMTREDSEPDSDIPRLHTHNADVDRVNDEKLKTLKGNARTFLMRSTGAPVIIEALKRGCLSPETLILKEGAVVMATKNNPIAGYVNGSVGVVVGFDTYTTYPIVELRAGARVTFEPIDFEVEENGKVRAKLSQIPLRLAWAITVHKSQGQSMDSAAIDLSRAFEYGQGYVALSRVRTLSGVYLLGWNEHALAMHPSVAKKDAELRALSEKASEVFALLSENGERVALEQNFIRASGGNLIPQKEGAAKVKKSTQDETFELLQTAKSLTLIAKKRKLTLGTIIDHVEKLVQAGRVTKDDVEALVSEKLIEALPDIHTVFDKKGTKALAPVFSALRGAYSYDEIRLARVLYE
jgi:hypothetical protein